MDLSPFGVTDITPRVSGIMDLFSTSDNGVYEIREYICGMDGFKLISRGNYSDISMMIGSNTCIKIANIMNGVIHVDYHWEFGSTINVLFITTIVLYVIFLLLFGACILVCCGFGGKILQHIYDSKIKHLLASNDSCIVPPLCIETVTDLAVKDNISVTHFEPIAPDIGTLGSNEYRIPENKAPLHTKKSLPIPPTQKNNTVLQV